MLIIKKNHNLNNANHLSYLEVINAIKKVRSEIILRLRGKNENNFKIIRIN